LQNAFERGGRCPGGHLPRRIKADSNISKPRCGAPLARQQFVAVGEKKMPRKVYCGMTPAMAAAFGKVKSRPRPFIRGSRPSAAWQQRLFSDLPWC